MLDILRKDPFRLFFPIATLCLLYGCALWVFFGLFNYGDFPVNEHTKLFIGGFLYFSIFGFLLTAIPRFTQTEFLTKLELFFEKGIPFESW